MSIRMMPGTLWMLSAMAAVLMLSACATPRSAEGPAADEASASTRGASAQHAGQRVRYPVVPQPQHLEPRDGAFVLDGETRLLLSDPQNEQLRASADLLATLVRDAAALPMRVAEAPTAGSADGAPRNAIVLRLTGTEEEGQDREDGLAAGRYRIDVTPEAAVLTAPSPRGLFYGVQTLRQLLPAAVEQGMGYDDEQFRWAVPAVRIEDAPRFSYRGMHLDVGRHFFPVAFIKRYIDLLALYKFNTFHWHLTEDQGWRIEIEEYPRLTEVGACRDSSMVGHYDAQAYDGAEYCGHYTQDEVREVVRYAQERFVRIIPEIEMPGHSRAALAAYPELGCDSGPYSVATTWGIHEEIYCPKEETFQFLENVLREVMALFPSRYIHIGGDEAPKAQWEESAVAQRVIEREGLAGEEELQSYFIRRIARFLEENGHRLIGWDEILEGGLPPNATVMSWRGMEGGIQAAHQGHDVIMTPTSHVYFDYYQADPAGEPLTIGGLTTLRDVYGYHPVPDSLRPETARHIIGAQGNVWTEYMNTPDKVEYMVFPRLLALSEVVWSPEAARSWDRFTRRLPAQLRRLDALDVNYRFPEEVLAGGPPEARP